MLKLEITEKITESILLVEKQKITFDPKLRMPSWFPRFQNYFSPLKSITMKYMFYSSPSLLVRGFLTIILLSFFMNSSIGQSTDCAVTMSQRDYDEAVRNLANFTSSTPTSTATVPVIFWVVLDDNLNPSNGASITDVEVEAVLDFMDEKFSTHPDYDFDFINCGMINIIKNSILQSGGMNTFEYAYCPFAMNIYIEKTPGSSVSDYPWDPSYNNRIFLKNGYDLNSSKFSLTHEAGHSFGLFHTFEPDAPYISPPQPGQGDAPYNTSGNGIPRELVIRLPDQTKIYTDPNWGEPWIKGGDFIGDTPAACRENGNFPGCKFTGCNYTGNYVDYNGDPINDPTDIIAKNFMSYAPCRQDFTNGQLLRVWDYYDNQRRYEYRSQLCGNLNDKVEYKGTDIGIENVAIVFTQASGTHKIKNLTGPDGSFKGIVLPPGVGISSASVSAKVTKLGSNPDFSVSQADWHKGVSIYDAVLINKHILAIDKLDGYDQIAADVNNSGTVSGFDIVEIRKMSLGIIHKFAAFDHPYRFLRESVTQADYLNYDDNEDDNPFDPYYYSNIEGTLNYSMTPTRQGFDAIKLGDVNGSFLNNFASEDEDGAIGEPIYVDIVKRVFDGVSTYDFKVQDFQNIVAYQIDIDFPETELQLAHTQALDLVGVNSEFFGTNMAASDGLIKTVWYDEANASAVSLSNGSGIFRLVFNGSTSQAQNDVHLSSNTTYRANDETTMYKSVAYLSDGKVRPIIQREYYQGDVVAVTTSPNPFTNSFNLIAEAEKDGIIELKMFTSVGQTIYNGREEIFKGSNSIEIRNLENLPSGIYFVSLKSGGDTIVKKMIKKN